MLLKPAEVLYEEDEVEASRLRILFPSSNAFQKLIEHGVLRPQPNGSCRIQFVGVVVAGNRSFQVAPKIFKGESFDVAMTMRHVVRALRKFSAWAPLRQEEEPFLRASAEATPFSAIAISDWLIRDYLVHGIYRRAVHIEKHDGSGQISWSRTIDRVAPWIAKRRPIYFTFITRASARDSEHFVSRLHRYVMELAVARYGHLLGYAPFSLDHEPFELFVERPPQSLSLARLSQEMREAFSDRAMRLIPMIIALLKQTALPPAFDLSLYGTTAFHRVWEAVCAALIGNDLPKWEKFIPRPAWYGPGDHRQFADTFVPDVVTSFESGGQRWFLIADAKYYRLKLPPSLRGQPGVNDVAKQLWYQRCLEAAAIAGGHSKFSNVFVVPGPPDPAVLRAAGRVELESFGLRQVGIIWLSSLDALQRYADGRRLPMDVIAEACMAAAGGQH